MFLIMTDSVTTDTVSVEDSPVRTIEQADKAFQEAISSYVDAHIPNMDPELKPYLIQRLMGAVGVELTPYIGIPKVERKEA